MMTRQDRVNNNNKINSRGKKDNKDDATAARGEDTKEAPDSPSKQAVKKGSIEKVVQESQSTQSLHDNNDEEPKTASSSKSDTAAMAIDKTDCDDTDGAKNGAKSRTVQRIDPPASSSDDVSRKNIQLENANQEKVEFNKSKNAPGTRGNMQSSQSVVLNKSEIGDNSRDGNEMATECNNNNTEVATENDENRLTHNDTKSNTAAAPKPPEKVGSNIATQGRNQQIEIEAVPVPPTTVSKVQGDACNVSTTESNVDTTSRTPIDPPSKNRHTTALVQTGTNEVVAKLDVDLKPKSNVTIPDPAASSPSPSQSVQKIGNSIDPQSLSLENNPESNDGSLVIDCSEFESTKKNFSTNMPSTPTIIKQAQPGVEISPKSLPQPRTTSATGTTTKKQNQQITSQHNHHQVVGSSGHKRKKFRTPLSDMYQPYIQPTDANLEDARKRLQTALEQTRTLRMAFTDRVYEKYKILLKLQSLALETKDIVDLINKDPKGYFESLTKDVDVMNAEKELEKKEACLINAQLTGGGVNNDMCGSSDGKNPSISSIANDQPSKLMIDDHNAPSSGIDASETNITPSMLALFHGVENAEQLSWYTSGLSLVILPEDNLNESYEQIEERQIKYRSPIDLETGCRVKDISPAAAVAGSVMLDRVRKGKQFKMLRRNEIGQSADAKDYDNVDLVNFFSHIERNNSMVGNSVAGRADSSTGHDLVMKSLSIGLDQNNVYSSKFGHDASNAAGSGGDTINDGRNYSIESEGVKGSQSLPYSFLTSTALPSQSDDLLAKVSTTIPSNVPSTVAYMSGGNTSFGGKSNRARTNNSLVTLLSLSPTIEGRRKSGKLSACASALVTHGISHIPSSKKGGTSSFGHGGYYNHHQSMSNLNNTTVHAPIDGIQQQSLLRPKHPFPLSKGALCISAGVSASIPDSRFSWDAQYGGDNNECSRDFVGHGIDVDALLLPPLMTSIERKKQKDEDFVLYSKTRHLHPTLGCDVVKSIVESFESTQDECDQSNAISTFIFSPNVDGEGPIEKQGSEFKMLEFQ